MIARREVRERIRDRAFLLTLVGLIVVQLLVVAGGALSSLGGEAGGNATPLVIGYVGEEAEELVAQAREDQELVDAAVGAVPVLDRDVAEVLVRTESLQAVVLDEERMLVSDEASTKLDTLMQISAQRLRTEEALQRDGVSEQVRDEAAGGEPLSIVEVAPEQEDSERLVALVALPILFLFIYLYGWYVASGVAEEKSSRVVEVVLSAVRPRHLLAGKVLGLGVLGLGQLSVVFVLGMVVLLVTGLGFTAGLPVVLLAELLAFALGFLFYGALFAAAGALVSRQEDLQYTQLPLAAVLFGAFLGTTFLLGSPESDLSRWLSLLPPIAPLLMPLRIASDAVSWWEPLLALALMGVALALALALADRVYRMSALRFDGRVRLRSALGGPQGKDS